MSDEDSLRRIPNKIRPHRSLYVTISSAQAQQSNSILYCFPRDYCIICTLAFTLLLFCPPVHIDLTPFPGQKLLASSKLVPCCVQFLQCLQETISTLSLPLRHLVFFRSPLVGGAPPATNHCPYTYKNTLHRLQQCTWRLLHGWWQ